VPSAQVGDGDQQYGDRDVRLRASIPIKGGWDWDGTKVTGFRLAAYAGFQVGSAEVPYRVDRRNLYSLDAGLSAMHVLSQKTQLTWSLGAGAAEDNDTISSPKVRVSARLVALRKISDKLTLLYGGAYTFVLGKGRLVPILGGVWRPSSGTTIHVVAPISARVQHRLGSRLVIGAQAHMQGNQYRVANNDQVSSPTGDLRLRVRELRVGGEVGVMLGRSLVLAAEAGIATARRLTFADGKTELQALDVGKKPYVSINLRYSFSTRRPWEGFGG
jgi:hypothetical protein